VLADRGGLQAITQDAAAAGKSVDENLIKRITALKVQIDETNKRAERISASISLRKS